jgi:hypothetical protein
VLLPDTMTPTFQHSKRYSFSDYLIEGSFKLHGTVRLLFLQVEHAFLRVDIQSKMGQEIEPKEACDS